MIIIPYFWHNTILGIFLSNGGSSLWDIDSNADIEQILEENGFPYITIQTKSDITYVEIEYESLHLDDFYLSTDTNISDKDVWHIIDVPEEVAVTSEFKKILYTLTNTCI